MIRILVLADSAVVRAGLEAVLREAGHFELVRGGLPFVNLAQFSALRSDSPPDVILADITRNDLLKLPLPTDDANTFPLVLLMDDVSRSELVRALQAGARSILPRDTLPTELFAAIEAAAAGLTALGRDELDLLLPAANSTDHGQEGPLEALSTREVEVLALMAQGLPNKNIADRLGISEHTVKFHVSSVLSKLGASSRTDAVTRGLRNGLLVI